MSGSQLELPANKNRSFHAASLDSPRLQKLLNFLRDRKSVGATTFEITVNCQTTRASSDVSELGKNGVDIETIYEGKNESGRKIYRYILHSHYQMISPNTPAYP
jgi:hypothetical protein